MSRDKKGISRGAVLRTLALVIWLGVIVFAFLHRREVTLEGILNYTPDSPVLAALVLLLFFALKTLSVVLYSGLLFAASGVLFPLWAAILVNVCGVVLMALIPYLPARRLGAERAAALREKYPRLDAVAAAHTGNDFGFTVLLRCVKLVNFDVGSMYMGAARLRPVPYLLGSVAGMLPDVILFPLAGAHLSRLEGTPVWIALGLDLLIALLAALQARNHIKKYRKGEQNMSKHRGDRRDGTLLRHIDSMHYIMPLMYPNRCDNEAFLSERIDLTNVDAYLEKKNAGDPAYRYNLFQVIVTAVLKTITLRPKMNRFIANYNLYQRNEVSAAFTIKKIFTDEGDEALAFIHAKPEDNIDSVHDEMFRQISFCRGEGKDPSTASMDALQKVPLFLKKAMGSGARWLDRHGRMPRSVVATDPYQSSVVLSNLGSLGLHSGYHHLTNWGTTSVFCIIGEKKFRTFEDDEGNREKRDSIDIGLTIDERIADGFYYAKTVRLLRHLLEHPELLDAPLSEPVEF